MAGIMVWVGDVISPVICLKSRRAASSCILNWDPINALKGGSMYGAVGCSPDPITATSVGILRLFFLMAW